MAGITSKDAMLWSPELYPDQSSTNAIKNNSPKRKLRFIYLPPQMSIEKIQMPSLCSSINQLWQEQYFIDIIP
jgi:hypothetical protein